jgi:hypothetical protein
LKTEVKEDIQIFLVGLKSTTILSTIYLALGLIWAFSDGEPWYDMFGNALIAFFLTVCLSLILVAIFLVGAIVQLIRGKL